MTEQELNSALSRYKRHQLTMELMYVLAMLTIAGGVYALIVGLM